MIKAIWRAAAPSRLGMLLAVFSIVTLARLGGAVSEGDRWVGSESQTMISVVVLWLVLPVFVSMLATQLFRGEHAPWSWGLARPIPRSRLIGSVVAIDALTIGACMLLAWLVLGSATVTSGDMLGITSPLLAAGAYVVLYLLAAIAGGRTSSTMRAMGAVALVGTTMLVALTSLVSWAIGDAHSLFGLRDDWAAAYLWNGLVRWGDPGALTQAHTWWLLSGMAITAAALCGPLLAFMRTAQLAPGPARWSKLLMPGVGLVGLSALLLVAGWTQASLAAPLEAKTGDAELRVTAQPVDPNLTVRAVYLRFDAGSVPLTLRHDAVPMRGLGTWTFVDLSAGHYQACASVHRRGLRLVEHCVPIIVTDEPSQAISLDVSMAELGV